MCSSHTLARRHAPIARQRSFTVRRATFETLPALSVTRTRNVQVPGVSLGALRVHFAPLTEALRKVTLQLPALVALTSTRAMPDDGAASASVPRTVRQAERFPRIFLPGS